VLTKSSAYGSLGPYELRDQLGRTMEGIWQCSKVYPDVPASRQTYSRYDQTVIWIILLKLMPFGRMIEWWYRRVANSAGLLEMAEEATDEQVRCPLSGGLRSSS